MIHYEQPQARFRLPTLQCGEPVRLGTREVTLHAHGDEAGRLQR